MPTAVNKKRRSAAKASQGPDRGAAPTNPSPSRNAFWDVSSFSEFAMRIVAGARWVEAARIDALVRNPDGSESRVQHPEGLAELGRRTRTFGRFMADQINGAHGAEFLRLGAESLSAAKEMNLSTEELPVFAPATEPINAAYRDDKTPITRRTDDPWRNPDEPDALAVALLTCLPRDPTRLKVLVRAGIILRKDPGHRFLIREVRGWFVSAKEVPSGKTIQRMIKELNLKPASRGAPKGTQQRRRG